MNLIMLQLNIRSLLSHQSDLVSLLSALGQKNSRVDIVMLCETFLTDYTMRLVNIQGYKIINNNCKQSKGGGMAILIHDDLPFKRRDDLEDFKEGMVETTYIEIKTKAKKEIVFGSIYRPPNTTEKELCTHLNEIIPKVRSEKGHKQLILGMDHNLDLLKSNDHMPTQ